MQLFWKDKSILPDNSKKTIGETPLFPGTVALTVSCGPPGEMFQGFPGDIDSGSRGSSSPSIESQYLSSVDSFGSPLAPQECVSAGGVFSSVGSEPGGDMGGGEMPGSFVPTVTAITTSQDLQWMVQPTLVSSQASGHSGTTGTSMMNVTQPVSLSLLDPYDMPGPSYSSGSAFSPPGSETQGPAPGPIRQSRARGRRAREESLTPEEEAKRHVRRERNKLAAAKCRNRRKELTDRLQSETDDLEEEKAELEAEISELQKEKERLEFVLVTHQPGCKIPYQEEDQPPQLGSSVQQLPALRPPQQAGLLLLQQQQTTTPISIVGLTVKEDTSFYLPPAYTPRPPASSSQPQQQQQQQQEGLMQQEVAFSTSFYGSGELGLMGSGDSGGGAGGYNNNPSYTSSFLFTCPPAEGACGASAHQRNSSSEQSSSDNSLNSPSLLAL